MKRLGIGACIAIVGWSAAAFAESPRIHVIGGGAHAVGGTQSAEFASGGTFAGTVELPATSRLGVQATGSAFILSKGKAPNDIGIEPTSTGAGFLGTMGLRLRAYGATRVAGPWIDTNVGVAHTGELTRPAFDAHLGWDVRLARESRIDVGPFLGYTQIFQPNSELRGSDARILSIGIAVSLGAKERARPAEPVGEEKPLPELSPPPRVFVEDHDQLASAYDTCADGSAPGEDDCAVDTSVRIFEDRLLLDDVVHFEFDSAKVKPKSYPLVYKIARFIGSHPNIIDVSIEGHADEVGTEEYNQKLSEARARSMRALLVHFGVERSRLRVVAHGKSRPKVDTAKPDVRNRRVELFITQERTAPRPVEAGNMSTSHSRNTPR